jgi:hypothetical protein
MSTKLEQIQDLYKLSMIELSGLEMADNQAIMEAYIDRHKIKFKLPEDVEGEDPQWQSDEEGSRWSTCARFFDVIYSKANDRLPVFTANCEKYLVFTHVDAEVKSTVVATAQYDNDVKATIVQPISRVNPIIDDVFENISKITRSYNQSILNAAK